MILIKFLQKKDTALNYELPHLDEFDRFERGEMKNIEKTAYQQRLDTEPELAAEYKLYLKLKSGIRSFHRAELKKRLQNLSPSQTTMLKRDHSWQWAIAASVAIAVTAVSYFYNPFAPKQEQWQAAYIEDPGLPVLMGHNQNQQLTEAMNLYRQGQFSEALTSLPTTKNDTVAYYRGIFWLKLEKTDSALSHLERVRNMTGSAFKQKADYYTAMALWQGGRSREAKPIFKQMSKDPNHPFQEQASRILKDNNF